MTFKKWFLSLGVLLYAALAFGGDDRTGHFVSVQLQSPNGNGNYVELKAANQSAVRLLTFPDSNGTSGQVLSTNGSGVLSWTTPASGASIGGAVTGGTAGSVLFVNPSATLAQDNANFFWQETNKRLGLGTTTPGVTLDLQNATSDAGINIGSWGSGGLSFLTSIQNANGTRSSPTAIASGDQLFRIIAGGYNSVSYGASGEMMFSAAENFTSSARGTDIRFLTARTGSTSLTEKMRLSSNGLLGIGTTTPIANLDIAGAEHVGLFPQTSTTISSAAGAGDTTLTVASTAGYPSSGVLLIRFNTGGDADEAVAYTGTTATTFTGVTRGLYSSTASAHSVGSVIDSYSLISSGGTSHTNIVMVSGIGGFNGHGALALGLDNYNPGYLLDLSDDESGRYLANIANQSDTANSAAAAFYTARQNVDADVVGFFSGTGTFKKLGQVDSAGNLLLGQNVGTATHRLDITDDQARLAGRIYNNNNVASASGLEVETRRAAADAKIQDWKANGVEVAHIDSTGKTVITTADTSATFALDVTDNGGGSIIGSTSYSTANTGNFIGRHARGSLASPTAVQSGDQLANFSARGYNGSAFSTTAVGVSMLAAENWTPTANGSRINIFTQANGTTSQQTRMSIDQNGNVGIGTTTPTAKLEISDASTSFAARITNNTAAVGASGLLIDVPNLTGGSNIIQQWKANGAEVMAFTPNGLLNITQTFPGLAFSGSVAVQDVAGAPGIEIFVGGGFANTAIARTGNAVTAKFTSSGNMGLGISNADADERFVVGDGHIKTVQTVAPTAVPDATNLGTAPTCTLSAGATDTAGEVTIISDADAPGTPGAVCDLTFHAAYVGAVVCQVSPKNQVSSPASAKVYEAASTTDLVLSFGGGALPSNTYLFDYYCVATN